MQPIRFEVSALGGNATVIGAVELAFQELLVRGTMRGNRGEETGRGRAPPYQAGK